MRNEAASTIRLEPFCDHLRGRPPRCQRIKRNGEQCRNPAVRGLNVCPRHGAGFRSRVRAGKKKDPTTAAVKHRLYSNIQYDNIYTLIDRIEESLSRDGHTDRELAVVKALLEEALTVYSCFWDTPERLEPLINALEEELGRCLEAREPVEAVRVREDIHKAEHLLRTFTAYLDRVGTLAARIITLEKQRAETRARLAETKALEQFVLYIGKARALFHRIATAEQMELLEELLRRELLNPLRLELPPVVD
ncbi:MAG: hypothetical protein NZ585_10545 [Chloracidobacterium sp.]|nr:hypothetical protein [Chloracidobacterium sp.]